MSTRHIYIGTLLIYGLLHLQGSQQSAAHWNKEASDALDRRFSLFKNFQQKRAKNVIIFMGDGMGANIVNAARVLASQRQKRNRGGDDSDISIFFENFPFTAFSKTYSADRSVPDSACTATAYLCGVKTRLGAVGVGDEVSSGNCSQQLNDRTTCIGEWALKAGKSVGVITDVPVTHASPAPIYAHAAIRKWRVDTDLSPEAAALGCKDIARQFVEDYPGTHIKVLLGAEKRDFVTNPEGKRKDKNLLNEWVKKKQENNYKSRVVFNKNDLSQVRPSDTDFLLGLFPFDDFETFVNDTQPRNLVPSLREMVRAAIPMLEQNENGYFLFIEAGRIDWAQHHNLAQRAIDEVIELEEAVKEAVKLTGSQPQKVGGRDDTLIVVTADHSHPFTMSGYPTRSQNILKEVRNEYDASEIDLGLDNLPYTSFMYSGGLGRRDNVSAIDTTSKFYRNAALVPLEYGSHSGEDVPVYAMGPMSFLFGGVQEQNYIAHAMAAASCMGEHNNKWGHCLSSGTSHFSLSLLTFTLSYIVSRCSY